MKKPLIKILQCQGFGSRKECQWMIQKAGITIDDRLCHDPKETFETENLKFTVASNEWEYRERLYLAMHKPTGYECSHTPQHHDSVFELLPLQLLNRKIEIAGRLDVDTSGLLLFSDDGQFIHQITSPKKQVPKVYRVQVKHPFTEEHKAQLESGVELRQEQGLFTATDIQILSEREIELTIFRGCYHQVRRMIAAASNRVESLSRQKIGELQLNPMQLPEGEWQYLEPNQLNQVGYITKP